MNYLKDLKEKIELNTLPINAVYLYVMLAKRHLQGIITNMEEIKKLMYKGYER